MKSLLIVTISIVLFVGCGDSSTRTITNSSGSEAGYALKGAVITENIGAVKQHLAAGVDVNWKDETGETALHWVARPGHKVLAELFISKGVNVNATNYNRMTPLHLAAMWNNKETIVLLIAKGADVNTKDVSDRTPLDLAKHYPEIIDLLRKHDGKTGEELKAEAK